MDLISLGKPGKFVQHFLHNGTMISIIAPGKSLNKTIPIFKQRLIGFLNRHGYSALIDKFVIDNNIVIYTIKSRSMLGLLT